MQTEAERAVDTSSFDGNAAMTACESASDYAKVCAGRKEGDPDLRSSWALPHHQSPGAPANAAGVRNALSRLPQTQGLTNREEAQAHLERHMAEISPERTLAESPHEIVRALAALKIEPARDGSLATLTGQMARFGEWAPITSVYEGKFVESVAPGAFAQTIERDSGRYRAVFEHGQDPNIGRKSLGPITDIGEDATSAFYEVALLDTDYNRSLLPGLEKGLYGSSFRGDAEVEVRRVFGRSEEYNPDGLDEHVIRTVTLLKDLGPCLFPAYLGTSAVARSMTDEFMFSKLTHGDGLQRFAEYAAQVKPIEITGTEEKPPEDTPRTIERTEKEDQVPPETETTYDRPEDVAKRRTEVVARQGEIAKEFPAGGMPETIRTEWDGLKTEKADLERRLHEAEELRTEIERNGSDAGTSTPGEDRFRPESFQTKREVQRDIFDPVARRQAARTPEDEHRLEVDDAMRCIEMATFPHDSVNAEDAQGHAERLIQRDSSGETPKRVLVTGDPAYLRAFAKVCRGSSILTSVEQQALERAAFTLGTTGMPVVWTLDPTVIRTSSYVINPLRAISRIETITGTNEWRGVTSGAVTATYEAEATEAADQTPTLTQPSVQVQRAQTFVPFSREVDQDWGAVQTEMAGLFAEAKDILEATQFLTGAGTTVFPQGILTGLTTTQRVQSGTTGVFAVADLYNLQGALPPRARAGTSTFLSSLTQYNRVRALDTGGGGSLWVQLQDGLPPQLAGMPAYELSTMTTTLAGAGNKIMLVGDFSKGFLIVDRIGMEIELIPHLFGATNRYPTGQRGLWAMWRNSSKVLDANRFRYLETI